MTGETGQTDSSGNGDPWDPGGSITLDRDTNEYVIDEVAFEQLKSDPTPLLGDSSQLRETDDGYYIVIVTGELTDSLGWEIGDILLAVNDLPLQGLSDFADAYAQLCAQTEFEVTVLRDRSEVVLRYRVE